MNLPKHFPLNALTPRLQQAAYEIAKETEAPIASVVSALLAAISLVCQGKLKIRKRRNLISTVSMWFIVVLGSGERKSTVKDLVFKAVKEFMAEQDEIHRQKMTTFNEKTDSWKAEAKGILAAIKKKAAKGESTVEDQCRLDQHNSIKPMKPIKFKLLHEKFTPLAIIKNLSECYPTTGIISDEAACVFSGRGLSDMGLINRGLDGSMMSVERASEESLIVREPAITMALYVQQEIIDDFFNKKGSLARAIGLLARCYYVAPPGTAGTRLLANSVITYGEATQVFHQRCKEILESHVSESVHGLPEKSELVFAPDAQSRWECEHDHIELMMQPGGYFENDKDFASKLADKMARLAALLHYFEGYEGPISLDTLERSIDISIWFAEEFVRNFAKPQLPPKEQVNANLLLCWLANFVRTSNQWFIKKNDLRQYGPNPLRNKIDLNAALLLLWQQGILAEAKNPEDKSVYITLNSNYFTPYQIQVLCSQGGTMY